MQLSKTGIELLKHFEGCELKAYQDSVGVWTIGYIIKTREVLYPEGFFEQLNS